MAIECSQARIWFVGKIGKKNWNYALLHERHQTGTENAWPTSFDVLGIGKARDIPRELCKKGAARPMKKRVKPKFHIGQMVADRDGSYYRRIDRVRFNRSERDWEYHDFQAAPLHWQPECTLRRLTNRERGA